MLKLTDIAEDYLNEFKLELEKFEDVAKRSIPIVQHHVTDDPQSNKIMHRIHTEQLEEYHDNYWRLVTKLDTVKNLIVMTDEKYESLENILSNGLTQYCKLIDVNKSQTEKNNYVGDI